MYRCVYVRYADRLSLKDNNLVVKNEKGEVVVPLEDIAMVLLEDNRSIITGKLMSAFAQNYIGLIVCDDTFVPCSITLPLHMHYRQLRTFNMQIDVKKPFNSQCWESIIRAKIRNQRKVIELTTKNEYCLEKLKELEKDVKSGDKTNREGLAAKIFFDGLYGAYFTRRQKSEDEINAALNYGYTILATNMSRLLAMYGFNTMLGIHHRSQSNNFNLSYDLVEPFRALVDYYVYDTLDDLDYPLTTSTKKGLIRLLVEPIWINDKRYLVEHAMEEMVKSYIAALEKEDSKLLLMPEILEKETIEEDEIIL